MTKHRSLQDDLAEEFEPSPLPIGRDGSPVLEPLRPDKKPYPRLCEAGPCVHYHRMETQFDAAAPIAERVEEGGKLVGVPSGAPFHTKVHHYCYPEVGIETDLGSMPVVTCNRWEPITAAEILDKERRRAAFRVSVNGEAHQAELAAWHAEQVKVEEDEAIDPLSLFVTMHVTDECEVDVMRDSDPPRSSFEVVVMMTAQAARDNLETPYLRSEFGPGSYSICVMKGEPAKRELVAQTYIEVTP